MDKDVRLEERKGRISVIGCCNRLGSKWQNDVNEGGNLKGVLSAVSSEVKAEKEGSEDWLLFGSLVSPDDVGK